MKASEKTRFDTRLPKDQKAYFEYAANLGGFRTLTEFVIFSVQQQASNIVEKHNSILASKKDQDIFFNTIMNPPKPNINLRTAASRFNKAIAGK
ncbi:MAG: DUF1778 domain-containing protein [Bacteroidota bacterium]|nr:DUF1778 domain-containing protein [Bacteroidota bacterium]